MVCGSRVTPVVRFTLLGSATIAPFVGLLRGLPAWLPADGLRVPVCRVLYYHVTRCWRTPLPRPTLRYPIACCDYDCAVYLPVPLPVTYPRDYLYCRYCWLPGRIAWFALLPHVTHTPATRYLPVQFLIVTHAIFAIYRCSWVPHLLQIVDLVPYRLFTRSAI